MTSLSPLDVLFDHGRGADLPLPAKLSSLYGRISFPLSPDRPYVISNFVSTIDGVVALEVPGKVVGDVVSGSNEHDSAIMGLLRSVADIVMVGSGTLRASPEHIWTAEHVFPPLAGDYRALRSSLTRTATPLNVIVTAEGNIDPDTPLFQSGKVEVLVVTTGAGVTRMKKMEMPSWVRVTAPRASGHLTAGEILGAVGALQPGSRIILVEGGPHLMGNFFHEGRLDELFLTLSPQVGGRERSVDRLGFVAQRVFSPDDPLWGSLVSVRKEHSHLFLRYAFDRRTEPERNPPLFPPS
jgi:riboflavin biosynthesis pyrimidine reductase